MRGGIKTDGTNWSYHCFNCDFKCGFMLGKTLTGNTRKMLIWCGIDEQDITKWNLYSLQHKDLLDLTRIKKKKKKVIFDEVGLPDKMEPIYSDDPRHRPYVEYLKKRGLSVNEYPFMVTPDGEGRDANRIIIPFTHENKIVGYTSRYTDNRIPKFITHQQPGFLFGYDLQKPDWEVCLVFEGIFDALSLSGCALTTNTISEAHADALRNLQRKIIIVPDHDKPGLSICDQALELGFYISIPDWSPEIKDANDAIIKYGRLPTLLSILQSATNSKIKVQMQRRKIDKRI